MKKRQKYNILLAILVFFLGGGAIYYYLDYRNSKFPEPTQTLDLSAGGVENRKMADEYSGQILGGNRSLIFDFYVGDYEKALKTGKPIVLYFYTNSSPACIKEFSEMIGAFNELENDGVVGFRVNYNDNQTDPDENNLAGKMGVNSQCTKVLIENENRFTKYYDSWSKNKYLEEIDRLTR